MKNSKLWVILYSVAILLALIGFVSNQENAFKNAVSCKFKCTFYDPVQPFSGRYLNINFDNITVPLNDTPQMGKEVYLLLGADSMGYTIPLSAQYTTPAKGGNFIILNNNQYTPAPNMSTALEIVNQLSVELPFNRFYVPEEDAPKAEELIRKANTNGEPVWISVLVSKGKFRVEDLYIGDQKLSKILHP